MTNTGRDDFITYWAQTVGKELGLEASTLEDALNDSQNDSDLRSMWKYAASKGVNATPSAFVNGVNLDEVPTKVEDWMALLDSIYNSQHRPSSVQMVNN